jgi:hypothetical protein
MLTDIIDAFQTYEVKVYRAIGVQSVHMERVCIYVLILNTCTSSYLINNVETSHNLW